MYPGGGPWGWGVVAVLLSSSDLGLNIWICQVYVVPMILLMVGRNSRNPPVEGKVVEIYHHLQGLIHPRWWSPDFFHQQYQSGGFFCLIGMGGNHPSWNQQRVDTWKLMLGRWNFPLWDGLFSGALLVLRSASTGLVIRTTPVISHMWQFTRHLSFFPKTCWWELYSSGARSDGGRCFKCLSRHFDVHGIIVWIL